MGHRLDGGVIAMSRMAEETHQAAILNEKKKSEGVQKAAERGTGGGSLDCTIHSSKQKIRTFIDSVDTEHAIVTEPSSLLKTFLQYRNGATADILPEGFEAETFEKIVAEMDEHFLKRSMLRKKGDSRGVEANTCVSGYEDHWC